MHIADDALSVNIMYSVEDSILIENFCKLKNYDDKNLLENFLAKVGQFLV